jgi:aspartate aminotransferase
MPVISEYFKSIKPSAIRTTQIKFSSRSDDTKALNAAIGNVSLPLHPALKARLDKLGTESPFQDGVVQYTATIGMKETNDAFLNIIASSGYDSDHLYSQVTDGGSQAMDLVILGTCGAAGSNEKPLMLIDPAYTNYKSKAGELGRKIVSISRNLEENGTFALPLRAEIEKVFIENNPGCLVVIPYDNPTGSFLNKEQMIMLAELCVKYDTWMLSDEAYREAFYTDSEPVSIWGLTNKDVPGIEGRRISIETASKIWNGCGLRIGALITDNQTFHQQSIAANTPNLCSNAMGQYIFGALAHLSHKELQSWYQELRNYYKGMMIDLYTKFNELIPDIIFSKPDAAFYSIIDVRNIADDNFDAMDFALFCASKGRIFVDNEPLTLLLSPMAGFYNPEPGKKNPGKTQLRISYVLKPDEIKKVPQLFKDLYESYIAK